MRAACPTLALVVPGVRPAGAALGDQKRVATPASAIAAGADYLVVGRPIRDAAEPGRGLRGHRRRSRSRAGRPVGVGEPCRAWSSAFVPSRSCAGPGRARSSSSTWPTATAARRSKPRSPWPRIAASPSSFARAPWSPIWRPRPHHQGMVAVAGEFQYARVDEMLAAAGGGRRAAAAAHPRLHHRSAELRRAGAQRGGAGRARRDRSRQARGAGDRGGGQGLGRRQRAHAHRPRAQPARHHRLAARAGRGGVGRRRGARRHAAGAGRPARADRAGHRRAKGAGCATAVARRCSALVQIPQRGQVASLNASAAGAILLYEAVRQRRA